MKGLLTGGAIGLLFGGVSVGAASMAWSGPKEPAPRAPVYNQIDLFTEVFSKIKSDYVEPVDDTKAMSAAIDGMLTSLDPHSGYLPPDQLQTLQVNTSGEYGGLGIEVTMEDGFIKVITPMDTSPASLAGIKAGDLITAINGKPILGLKIDDAVRDLRGPIGSSVTITILREQTDPFEVTLKREVIKPNSAIWRIEDKDIAYFRVSTFNERTTSLLDAALKAARAKLGSNPKGIILDLRNNGGGLLDQAVSVSDFFLSGGEVVSTIGRKPDSVTRYSAETGEVFKGVPMIVLINAGTASASEIVAGALKDQKRAIVLGMTSFGKGSVQSVIPLGSDRGAIRLTTARYYTPSGASIQGTGIIPDKEVANERLSDKELLVLRRFSEAVLPNALGNETGQQRAGPHIPADQPPADYKGSDYQLERAIDYLRGGLAETQREAKAG